MLTGMLALALLTTLAPAPITSADEAEANTGINVRLNGETLRLAAAPQLVGSTLMVPLRELAESLGAAVQWDEATSGIIATKGERSLRLTLGSRDAERNGKTVALAEAPFLSDGTTLVPLRIFSETFDFNVYWDGANRVVAVADADKSLPTVGSEAHMRELMKEAEQNGAGYGFATGGGMPAVALTDQTIAKSAARAEAGSAAAAAPMAPAANGGADYSRTNVQVEGVDEADVIKTDGEYIYQVNRNRIIVARAIPAAQMSVVSTLTFEESRFQPQEMYVDGKHLIVIGTSYEAQPSPPAPMSGSGDTGAPATKMQAGAAASAPLAVDGRMAIWPGPAKTTTKTIVYDLTDRSQLRPVRETELEGAYVSSRKIGDSLYVVANKAVYRPWLMRGGMIAEPASQSSLPSYRDSAAGNAFIQIGYEDIRYFPKSAEPNYLLIGGLNLEQPDAKLQVSSYLGSGSQVYASADHLYVTVTETERTENPEPALPDQPVSSSSAKRSLPPAAPPSISSAIYKFALADGAVTYKGRGKVPGTPLNQYAMDEHNGYFRIATTKGEIWRTDEFTSKNNVYVLDEAMNIAGRLEDIAPGERIYSVRYMGERAYMVTFKTTDPLFVLDLKTPTVPHILGQLKIPGYSDYLHPYDENHLIGFGKEAVEVANKAAGNADTVAYYQGMKLVLFDVTDVANPKELFKETIGDRGTDSELLHNPKALLFSKEKNMLAFPVSVAEIPNKASLSGPEAASAYGEFVFQGAYVYRLDLERGFQLRGKLTHLTADDLQKAGRSWYGSDRNIQRLLYIGDTLYSASPSQLKANDLASLAETGSLTLPPWTPSPVR